MFGIRGRPSAETIDLHLRRPGSRREPRPAQSACDAEEDLWRRTFLFLRRDLITDFAGDRGMVQVGWGERGVAAGLPG
jgi:hypothetical protein